MRKHRFLIAAVCIALPLQFLVAWLLNLRFPFTCVAAAIIGLPLGWLAAEFDDRAERRAKQHQDFGTGLSVDEFNRANRPDWRS